MFEELKGKRLLVLGGTAWADILFAFAHHSLEKISSIAEPKIILIDHRSGLVHERNFPFLLG